MRMRVAAMCYGDDGAAAGVDVVCDDVHTMDTQYDAIHATAGCDNGGNDYDCGYDVVGGYGVLLMHMMLAGW